MSCYSEQRGHLKRQTDHVSTIVKLAERSNGTWEATQPGLDVVGTGDSAARATEDLARRIAELQEDGEL